MESKFLFSLGYSFFFFFSSGGTRLQSLSNLNSDASPATAIQLPAAFSSDSSSSDSVYSFANAKKIEIRSVSAHEDSLVDGSFDHEDFKAKPSKHRSAGEEIITQADSGPEHCVAKDLDGIQTLHTSIAERRKRSTISRTPSKDDDDVVRNSGLLGLGRGPLSFASQLQPTFLYGDAFSDHLVEGNSKLMFEEDQDLHGHHWRWGLNFSTLVAPRETPVLFDWINSVVAGREELINVAEATWNASSNGLGWKDTSHCLLSTKAASYYA